MLIKGWDGWAKTTDQISLPLTAMSDEIGQADPEVEDVFQAIRKDYEALGLLKFVEVGGTLNSLVVSSGERLDPSPTADEREFWQSPLGIDGWQPDFSHHHYPAWLVDYRLTEDGEELEQDATEDPTPHDLVQSFLGPFETNDMPDFRFNASNLTKNESVRMHHRVRNLCPAKQLEAIAKNCNESPEGKANPSHCWRENSLLIKCNEFKKTYLNNRQRFIYIYGSMRDDLRDWDEEDEHFGDDPGELDYEALYVFRWEFYRLQYKEAKRNQYIRQMNAFKQQQKISFWKRLTTPSTWFTSPVAPPQLPTHVKNYMFQGHHWLTPEDASLGLPMSPETIENTEFGPYMEYISDDDVAEMHQDDD